MKYKQIPLINHHGKPKLLPRFGDTTIIGQFTTLVIQELNITFLLMDKHVNVQPVSVPW